MNCEWCLGVKGAHTKPERAGYFILSTVLLLFLSAMCSAGTIQTTITPPCALKSASPSVTVCTPVQGSIVSLPVHIVAGIKDSNPLQKATVLIDGTSVYQTGLNIVDIYVPSLSAGTHMVVVKALDTTGASFSQSLSITVTANAGLSNIRHIIFYMQENHSFDNYFGMLGRYRVSKGLSNNIDGLKLTTTLYNTKGQPVHPYHFRTVCTEGVGNAWSNSWEDADGGKMDKFMNFLTTPSQYDPTGTRAMGYYDQTDLPYYYELAAQFATSDRYFSSLLSGTNPNRMYLFAGTSFGHVNPDQPPSGGWPQPTIFDHLDQAGITWWYYYQDNGIYLPQWQTYSRDASKLRPISDWYTDIQNQSMLPQVIFIERAGPTKLDEHPPYSIQRGAANTAKILNALLASPSWASSVFILTYDEYGGQYDHVIPACMVPPDGIAPILQPGEPKGSFAYAGYRVPVMVVSPWVKPNYVSHTWRDHTSILRFIEDRFSVTSLSARDASADNMMEFFDFSTPHWLTPPPLPLQPTNGTCDISLEKAPGF
jgi:phospholipase C